MIDLAHINNMNTNEQLQRRRKTKIKGETSSFTCFLTYFVVKILVLLVLFKYDNFLKHETIFIIPFVALLILNTYLMLTTGKDPGFENSTFQENQLLHFQKNQSNYCQICNCRVKNRTKHCFYCGKCVRKFDHHCPWIGSCVGEKNHGKFWLLLLAHTLQSSLAFYICLKSLGLYEYRFKDGHFSPQYGVFSVFAIFMLFYIGFAGGLLGFHSYLLLQNTTSRELFSRGKCAYLRQVRGNPFSKGILNNIAAVIKIQQDGREWLIESKNEQKQYKKTFLSKVWKNDYYSCC